MRFCTVKCSSNLPMTKNFTINETQKLLPEFTPKSIDVKRVQPSGITMKFVFGYAAALQVCNTHLIGSIRFLAN